jgi:hypothetical protein
MPRLAFIVATLAECILWLAFIASAFVWLAIATLALQG